MISSLISSSAISATAEPSAGTCQVTIQPVVGVHGDLLQQIAPLVKKSIADGYYPGAIIIAAHQGKLIYRGVFGNRRIEPTAAPMTFDTIFDIASLTKVIATTPAIMQMVEQGKLQLDKPVATYWPAFASYGKEKITIRELLTHTSGFRADIPIKPGTGTPAVLQLVENEKLEALPGTKFIYSDINFIALAHLVEIASKEKFDHYVQTHIFNPLNMKETHFLPDSHLHDRIAPTRTIDNEFRWGEVNDFSAYGMGGVAGNAGLFSTANDLSQYAQCILNKGRVAHSHQYLLKPQTIEKMTSPQSPANIADVRGLGWDINSHFSCRGTVFSTQSFGHTGWTGTSMWIDPTTQTYVIILTSKTYPFPNNINQLHADRCAIADIVARSVTDSGIPDKT